MKYMTKEWYNTMQKTSIHILLKVDEQVKDFSEEYFQNLFKLEKEKWLSYKLNHTTFEEIFEARVNQLSKKLPSSILEKVSDIRVLALNYATQEIYDRIKEYCENNEQIVEKAMTDYNEELARQFKDNKPKFVQESFHDSSIIEFNKEVDDYLIKLNNKDSFTEVDTIIFNNAEIIKQDGEVNGSIWLYKEVYKVNDKYDIHILLYGDDLNDLIIRCSDVILI